MEKNLTILVGVFSIIGVILSIYAIVDAKIGNKKKEMDSIKERLRDHESRIGAAERVTETVESFMDELLIDSLRKNKRRQ